MHNNEGEEERSTNQEKSQIKAWFQINFALDGQVGQKVIK